MVTGVAQQPNAALKMVLQRQLALLERVLERVNEVPSGVVSSSRIYLTAGGNTRH